MSVRRATPMKGRAMMAVTLLLLAAGCAHGSKTETLQSLGLDPDRMAFALHEAQVTRANGQRLWCVPFARNASGVQIRGDAHTWWSQAADDFSRSKKPVPGAVMSFASTKGMPLGHVAVVSEVVDDRKILIDHANWHRNEVSLGMGVIDISDNNDWSRVRVETYPGAYGGAYPINGFILPETDPAL